MRKKSGLGIVIAALAVALAAVIAVIVWKQMEYGASEAFYDGLRGAARLGGIFV